MPTHASLNASTQRRALSYRWASRSIGTTLAQSLIFLAVSSALAVLPRSVLAQEREEQGAEIARLSRQLDADTFAARQAAERRLAEIGRSLAEQALADIEPPPEAPYGADRSDYFARIEADAQQQLRQRFYDHLAPQQEVEGRLRLRQIRSGLTLQIQERVLRLRAGFPQQLSDDERKLVEGYTGGFGKSPRWFEASYRNGSKFVITAARIHLRMQKDGKNFEHEILVGTSGSPIPPGSSGTWSGAVDAPAGASYEFFWRTIAVYGFPAGKQP